MMIRPERKNAKTRLLLMCGLTGSVLFVVLFLIEGFFRKDYNFIIYPISSLSIGRSGWIQVGSFILSGLLICVFAWGLGIIFRQAKDSIGLAMLFGGVGIGLIGSGIFSTDPLFGYPATAPYSLTQYTIHGHLHNFFSVIVFICLPTACFKFRKRFKNRSEDGWALYSMISGISMIVFFILSGFGFEQYAGFSEVAGLLQRLAVISGFAWMALIALYYLRIFSD
jgi:hypothetical protein